MRILHGVPGSVLWLYTGSDDAVDNLRREAEMRGVAPARLVFARNVPYLEHIARYALADLFLDTLPFNAGATASDALWAGVPVVTCAGEAFASRMAGSLLRTVGLPDLVTDNLADYEALALDLARSPSRLATIRQRLVNIRRTTPLFDTARFTLHLEAAYVEMWQRAERGELPQSFAVASTGVN
jgi:predicted O-linked N-acetylglucosamine transferase (SPINDLY family)